MRVLNKIGQCAAAAALLAVAVQSAYADISYTWIEGGASRLEIKKVPSLGGKTIDLDGGYLRGSFALGDNFYLLSSFSKNDGKAKHNTAWDVQAPFIPGLADTLDEYQQTTKLKAEVSQVELGFGFHIPVANNVDAIGEFIGIHRRGEGRWDVTQTHDFSFIDPGTGAKIWGSPYPQPTTYSKAKGSSNAWGGRALAGIRAQPFDMLDVWAKVGYEQMQSKDFLRKNTALGNAGVHFRITENFGLVGEADVFKKDMNQFRVGARLSF